MGACSPCTCSSPFSAVHEHLVRPANLLHLVSTIEVHLCRWRAERAEFPVAEPRLPLRAGTDVGTKVQKLIKMSRLEFELEPVTTIQKLIEMSRFAFQEHIEMSRLEFKLELGAELQKVIEISRLEVELEPNILLFIETTSIVLPTINH